MQSEYRLKVLEKIKEYERQVFWDKDVEDDPETIELLPDKIGVYFYAFFSNKNSAAAFPEPDKPTTKKICLKGSIFHLYIIILTIHTNILRML